MKQLFTLLILFVFATFVYAAPGGGKPHKVTSYDYHDFVSSHIQTKTFIRYQQNNYGVTVELEEVWSFDRNSDPPNVLRKEVVTDVDADPDEIVRCVKHTYQPTATSFNWIRYVGYMQEYCEEEDHLYFVRDYDPPVTLMTNAMVPGIAWGSAGIILDNPPTNNGYYVEKVEVLAVEDVTVPAGTFTGCLKVHKIREYLNDPYTRIEWICPDMGIVKRVHGDFYLLELESTIPPTH